MTSEYPLVSDYDYLLAMCLLERSRSDDLDEAEQSDDLIGAVVLLEGLVGRSPDEPEYLYQLSEAYERRYFDWWRSSRAPDPWYRGGPREERSPVPILEVEKSLRTALALSNRVVALQPHVPGYSLSNAMIHSRLAEVLTNQEKLQEAEQHLRTAVRVHEDVTRRSPDATPYAHGGKVWAQLGLAKLLMRQNKSSEAHDLLAETIAEVEAYRTANPEQAWFTNMPLAEMYRALAHLLIQEGDDTSARDAEDKAESLSPPDRRFGSRPRT